MQTTTRLRLLEPRLRWLGALMAAWLLAACGPGTGGTGTGPINAPTTSYSAVYTLPELAQAPQPGSEPIPPSGAAIGEPPGGLCTKPESSQAVANVGVTVALQAQGIQVTTPCASFTYAGPWSLSETNQVVVQGNWESPAAVGLVPATLSLSFGAGGLESTTVSFTVTDGAGLVLWGPVTLQRAANVPPV